jgi:two-component system LytT family response regulator
MARELLRRMLEPESDIEIVGTSVSGPEAVEAINQLTPDLVFLDVQMPELNGFEVLSQINRQTMPVIVFVTASDDCAVRAFEVHALDYLVKPCSRARLQITLERVRLQIQARQSGDLHRHLAALLAETRPAAMANARMTVKADGRILLFNYGDIDWVEAADNYVKLHVGRQTHLMRSTLGAIEGQLPKKLFLRISRSAIANVERIKELHPLFNGEFAAILTSGQRLTLTRGYRDKLKQLGIS